MPNFKFIVPHRHGKTAAVEKLKAFSSQMRSRLPESVSNVEETWTEDNTLEFRITGMGMEISGMLVSEENAVMLSGKLPFAALPFRGMIETQLKTGVEQALA